VALDDELVEVAGFCGLESMERDVVDDEQLDSVQFAHFVFVAAVRACPAEAFEQFVGAFGVPPFVQDPAALRACHRARGQPTLGVCGGQKHEHSSGPHS